MKQIKSRGRKNTIVPVAGTLSSLNTLNKVVSQNTEHQIGLVSFVIG